MAEYTKTDDPDVFLKTSTTTEQILISRLQKKITSL